MIGPSSVPMPPRSTITNSFTAIVMSNAPPGSMYPIQYAQMPPARAVSIALTPRQRLGARRVDAEALGCLLLVADRPQPLAEPAAGDEETSSASAIAARNR